MRGMIMRLKVSPIRFQKIQMKMVKMISIQPSNILTLFLKTIRVVKLTI